MRALSRIVPLALTGALVSSIAGAARADEARLRGAGIVGGALLGGELVGLGEALAGVEPGWAYALGMGIGAGAGGFTGHLLEQDTKPEVSAALLGAGMLLLIPSIVWIGNARRTKPPPVRDGAGLMHLEGIATRWALPRVDIRYWPVGGDQAWVRRTSVNLSLVF